MSKHRKFHIEAGPERSWRPDFSASKGLGFAATFLFCVSQWVSGETFRLSRVVAEGSAGSERVELKVENDRQILFVEKKAIVTGADVKSATRSPHQSDTLEVALTDQGGLKLSAATEDAHGDMRIAIFIDDKVVSAPVVNMKLGRNFVIEGLKEFPEEDLDIFGWRIQGKSDEEMAKLLRQRQRINESPPPIRPEPEYYSDEEYAALKKEREKTGMFYVDQLPTEQELGDRLKGGMSQADVIAEFGPASRTNHDDAGNLISLDYNLAPEKRSLTDEMRPDGIGIRFREGKVSRWGFSIWSSTPRQAKPQGESLRRLKAKLPGEGFADKDFGTVRWIEEIELFLQQGHDQPHAQDYVDLISMICSTATAAKELDRIEANCSVVKTLAGGFPEVDALRKTAQDGKISLIKLSDLLRPYMLGEKQLP
jgi:hypothetical protein